MGSRLIVFGSGIWSDTHTPRSPDVCNYGIIDGPMNTKVKRQKLRLVAISCHVSTTPRGEVPSSGSGRANRAYSPLSPGGVFWVSLVNPRTKPAGAEAVGPLLFTAVRNSTSLGVGN